MRARPLGMLTLDHARLVAELRSIQAALRDRLCEHMRAQERQVWSRTVRDDAGDTIFGIDADVEELLLERCRALGERQHFVLLAEGLDPAGVPFGRPGVGGPPFRLLVDPIDGTRGLMFDKRPGWCLMGAAPDRGAATRLADVEVAVMTELPTTRQATSDVLWACASTSGAHGVRFDLVRGHERPLPVVPSAAADLRHGFGSVANFFPGGKELTSRLEEAILRRALGGWNPHKAEIYSDQYISSGGQLAEVALGRDRFVLDVRPLVHRRLGVASSLTSRPYDVVTLRIAQAAGCVVCDPLGQPLDLPLDTTSDVAFACYANERLAARLIPIVREEVQRHLLD